MEQAIKVSYKSTNSAYKANQFLQEIAQHDLFAADFEAAVRYTKSELESFRKALEDDSLSKRQRAYYESRLSATALGHPFHVTLTHCSIAINDHEGYVFILDNPKITARILQFLITTPIKQLWHNASFDFKHIFYRTGKMPLNYEDTQIYAKTILNHVEVHKAGTGLKQLAGKWYGAWGISEDLFTLDQMYDEKMLLYAATDACATFKLYNSINDYVTSQESENENDPS
jgi:hypothetical protein